MKRMILPIVGILVAALVVVLVVYLALLRPRSHRWGLTDGEVGRSLPGDVLVPVPKVYYTQAITIEAPPEEVWPWLVQVGYGRAGWYTYDLFYNLTGSGNFYDGDRSAERIIPELQDLAIGDTIELAKGMSFEVVTLEQDRQLVLLARVDWGTGESFELSDTMPDNYINMSWVYLLEHVGEDVTRLTVRWQGDYSPGLGNAMALGIPAEAGALIMQPKLLRGIKARAEGHRRAEATGGQ
jgi:hypothetical protein